MAWCRRSTGTPPAPAPPLVPSRLGRRATGHATIARLLPRPRRKPEELFGSTSGSSTDPDEEEETAAAASGWPAAAAGRGAGRVKRLRRGGHVTLQEALDNTEDAVVMTQPHPPYAITHVNAPWCEMCGYTLEEVEGLSSSILQGAETDEALLSELMASVRRGESSSATLVNYKKGGARFLNQAHASGRE